MEISPTSPKIIYLNIFKEIANEIDEILSSPTIRSFCEPISDLTLIFSDIERNQEVMSNISSSDLPHEEIDKLKQFLETSFQTSFSYGYKNKEFVFIQLEKSSKLLKSDYKSGLQGLILHEIFHSVQRQRGLEVRLQNSLVFSLEFFTELASVVPPDVFDQEELFVFLKKISQFALFTLKDIYVNVEMIKRGFIDCLIDFYKAELRFEESEGVIKPIFDTPFQKGEIKIQNLEEFATAFNYTISLIPVWLPTMVLETDSKSYTTSRKLKHFIFDEYYTNPSLITREMWHIENIFLTSFSFSKNFHLKWFGAIFNLALEYLLGEDFVFYHLSKAAELVEEIYGEEEAERRRFAIVPILKAAYIHKIEYPVGIQQRNIDELEKMMKQYNIDDGEIKELEESLEEYSQAKDKHVAHFFENLLQLSIMILSRDIRKYIFQGFQKKTNEFGRAILTNLQAINYLGDQCDDEYYHSVRLTVKKILRNENDVFKQKKMALHLETIAKDAIFTSNLEATPSEVEELLFNYSFFEIPLSNNLIELGISFIHNIKLVQNKVTINDPDFPILTAQFIGVLLKEKKLNSKEADQINMVLVCSLIAASKVHFNLIQPVLEQFIAFGAPIPVNEETDDED
jgi:hypothetical protein